MPTSIGEIKANGMTFRTRFAGDTGEPVFLLHGFPETSHMWVELLPALEAAGYRCIAPDQRGYSPGARPERIEDYETSLVAGDVLAMADKLGIDKFHLVGHDWGAGAGWAVCGMAPERLLSWTALSVPHIGAFATAIQNDPDQQQKSQYITFFQEPGVAEAALSAEDYTALKNVWAKSSAEEIAEYLSVFRQPGALSAALNWYRGGALARRQGVETPTVGPVSVPTLFIWGNTDQAIGRVGVEAGHAMCTGPYTFVELDAGHWLVQEDLERVTKEILAHLKANPAA